MWHTIVTLVYDSVCILSYIIHICSYNKKQEQYDGPVLTCPLFLPGLSS